MLEFETIAPAAIGDGGGSRLLANEPEQFAKARSVDYSFRGTRIVPLGKGAGAVGLSLRLT